MRAPLPSHNLRAFHQHLGNDSRSNQSKFAPANRNTLLSKEAKSKTRKGKDLAASGTTDSAPLKRATDAVCGTFHWLGPGRVAAGLSGGGLAKAQ
jgi:hypothetical protein